jgi:hypothetical protein
MSPRNLLLPLVGFVLTLAAVGIMSCSKDDPALTAPTVPTAHIPTVHRFPLSDGTWLITGTLTPADGCTMLTADSWEDSVFVVDGVPDSDPFPDAPFNITGTDVTQTFTRRDSLDSSCVILYTTSGRGTVSPIAITIAYDVAYTPIGDCSSSGLASECTARVVLAGTRIATLPDSVNYASARAAARARGDWLARLKRSAAN